MNVTAAAKLLDISRPTLSNFLNGKADLSREMAGRLEAAFGVSARKLLDVQSAWDAAQSQRTDLASLVKPYVPPFLQIRASRIEEWGTSGISPRQRFAVLLRTLVNSTGSDLTRVDFPGNDASEQPGWDGEIVAGQATPWIPAGHSGWEFGVTKDIKGKADGDFAKSVAATDEAERQSMTFVFVTPRSWAGKTDWIKAYHAKGLWKEVRAYDSSDLEQWLEQSLAGQAWFASETGQDAQGAISLDEAAKIWAADSEPTLTPALFADAVASHRTTLDRILSGSSFEPAIIAADSKEEALAFLSAAFAPEDPEFGLYRDRIIVFRETGPLSRLASQVTNFIPVILSREVEREFAPFRASMPSFVIYPRNATTTDPDIILDTLGAESFRTALETMGVEKDRIDQLSRESGRSLTVLRRRLSQLPAVRTPAWASDHAMASHLIPFVLAGAWKADGKTDRAVLEILAGDVAYDELERRLLALLPLDSSPVWSAGSFRGVVSKIDLLFAIQGSMTTNDLQRFFDVASLVLDEEDPALELPENDQWAAAIYGKTRDISGALREGLAETLVLLAVYGPTLFKSRTSFDTAAHADHLVSQLLTPLTSKTLESQVDNLPLYSEAAPETFLAIVEADLRSADPAALELMRPIGDTFFGRSSRTGLLWALENLAWDEQLFTRTVLVLGRLAERVIDDNLTNKPSGSLSSIFRSWMPQTSANLEHRKAALKLLAERYPAVAWPICIEQFPIHSRIGHYSHKPRWRPNGHGKGNPIARGENNEFCMFAFRLVVDWPQHTSETLGDIIGSLGGIDESLHGEVWDLVERWAETADAAGKAALREHIRKSTLTRRAIKRSKDANTSASDRAKQIYDRLEPTDPVLRHEWLFRQAWVEESADELAQEDYDFQTRDARITDLRMKAVREVRDAHGAAGVLALAERGQAGSNAGWALAKTAASDAALVDDLAALADGRDLAGPLASLISGALAGAGQDSDTVLRALASALPEDKRVPLLLLAPFGRLTWQLADELGDDVAAAYWEETRPFWCHEPADLEYAIGRLLGALRPRAAFGLAQLNLKQVAPRQLYDMLSAIVTKSAEAPLSYQVDPYSLREAFKQLNESGQMTTDELAGLEFQFIDIFSHGDAAPVNLARRMEEHPELFVQAVAFVFKRDDDGVDPSELELADEEQRSAHATQCYKLLESIELVPGRKDGRVDAERMIRWIEQARASLIKLAREDVGDQMIGKMLAKSPPADDGLWPGPPVREALEQVANEHIGRGFEVAVRNARGAHWRGEGGAQERELARKYGDWAQAMEYTHPRVAAILREIEKSYLREAEWEDNGAKIARRMRY